MAALVYVPLLWICLVVGVRGHARLWAPPSRSSMWRQSYGTQVNINDNELNCGGFQNQWIQNGGKCGLCGDPYQLQPRDNERGGRFYSGIITQYYKSGDVIDLVVDLTANHLGYFEFRMCPMDGGVVTQDCFNKHPIRVVGSTDGRYHVGPHEQGMIRFKGELPPEVACKQCVLQWRYRTGNRWGCDEASSKCGRGLGPQEEFYNCADVAVLMPGSPAGVKHGMTGVIQRHSEETTRTKTFAGGSLDNLGPKFLSSHSDLFKSPPGFGERKRLTPMREMVWKMLYTLIKPQTPIKSKNVALVTWDPLHKRYRHKIVNVELKPGETFLPKGQWSRGQTMPIDSLRQKGGGNQMVLTDFITSSEFNAPETKIVPINHLGHQKKTGKAYFLDPGHLNTLDTKKAPLSPGVKVCKARPPHGADIDHWCVVNCNAGNCPPNLCTCYTDASAITHKVDSNSVHSKTPVKRLALSKGILRRVSTHRQTVGTKLMTGPDKVFTGQHPLPGRADLKSLPQGKRAKYTNKTPTCRGIGHYINDKNMANWCTNNCGLGFCPSHICSCVR